MWLAASSPLMNAPVAVDKCSGVHASPAKKTALSTGAANATMSSLLEPTLRKV